jgi:hypothetical protein
MRTQQHGVADGLRDRELVRAHELDAEPACMEPPGDHKRFEQLLDEEGHALRAIVESGCQRSGGSPFEHSRRKRARTLEIERLERELEEPSTAPEVAAQPAQRMPARNLVIAVHADEKHRLSS